MPGAPKIDGHVVRAAFSRGSCVLILAIAAGGWARGDEGKVGIAAREARSNVFGGETAEFRFDVKGVDRPGPRAGWRLTIEGRTAASGEVEVVPAADGSSKVALNLEIPPVKEGIVLPALLTTTLVEGAVGKSVATLESPLWIFPRNPFHDRTRWLKGLGLTLFDPAATTAEALRKLDVPFESARDVDAVAGLAEGVLIVGEGVSFVEQRGLADALVALAARGVPVLCLAPSGGSIPIPEADAAGSIALRRSDVIVALDKRLDAENWPGAGEVAAVGLVLKTDGDRLMGEASADGRGWPWVEVGFRGRRNRLVVCGFGLMSHWDAGPTPRFLFARALEAVVGADPGSDRSDAPRKD